MRRLAAESARERAEIVFLDYIQDLVTFGSLKYLSILLLAMDNYWLAVVANLIKARKKWVRMLRILGQEGEDANTSGTFSKHTPNLSSYLSQIHGS